MSVDLGLTADQEAIADLFGGFFTNESPTSVARAAEPFGFDAELWAKVIELGAPGMGSAVEHGGGGAGEGSAAPAIAAPDRGGNGGRRDAAWRRGAAGD